MNTKNQWIVVLSGGVLTTLVSNLPIVGFVNCLLFAGLWGSAIFTAWLYRRLNGTLTINQGVYIGALTGVCAGVLGFILGFMGVAGIQGIVNNIELLVPGPAGTGTANLPAWGALVFNLFGVFFNVIFGTIGGWIGGAIFRTDRQSWNAVH